VVGQFVFFNRNSCPFGEFTCNKKLHARGPYQLHDLIQFERGRAESVFHERSRSFYRVALQPTGRENGSAPFPDNVADKR
jgi:hypothetical protein